MKKTSNILFSISIIVFILIFIEVEMPKYIVNINYVILASAFVLKFIAQKEEKV